MYHFTRLTAGSEARCERLEKAIAAYGMSEGFVRTADIHAIHSARQNATRALIRTAAIRPPITA